MAAFAYRALAADGTSRRGFVEADSERQARRVLRERDLLAVSVTASAQSRQAHTPASRGKRLASDALVLFTQLLATLLRAGLPLNEALAMVAAEASPGVLKDTILALQSRIEEGRSFEDALAEHPRAFPEVYRATVGAGEQTHHLPLVLDQLAAYIEARERIRQSIRVAMLYPAVLTLTAMLVVAGLLIYVVPDVIKVFTDVGQQLPLATRILISISNFAETYGLLTLVLAALALQAVIIWARRPRIRLAIHKTVMRLPVFGSLAVQSDFARFARTLSMLLGSGVDVLDALKIGAKSVGLLPLQRLLEEVVRIVREGGSLSSALATSKFVPALLVHLAASGENSGELPKMLETAALGFEHKTRNFIALALAIVEPALIFVMGGIVLFIVIAILLPIFEMNQLV